MRSGGFPEQFKELPELLKGNLPEQVAGKLTKTHILGESDCDIC